MKRCDSCDIDLTASVMLFQGRAYCCSGCADGGPCVCTYESPADRVSGNGHASSDALREILGRNWESGQFKQGRE